jgi:uncharacterized protein YjiS (DUF1127 family)
MAHATHAIPGPAPTPHQQTVARFLKREWTAYLTHRAQRATVRILHDLDDVTLRDIGLSRSEVDSVVYGTPGDRRVNYNGR